MNHKQKRIMVADDDTGILDSISIMLDFEGYDVSTTVNGATVIDMKENLPDLLLLDIWMSGEDGKEICKILKQQPTTKNIPIIMISASKDVEKSAIEAGANDFLAKPFEMNDLLHKIDVLINKK